MEFETLNLQTDIDWEVSLILKTDIDWEANFSGPDREVSLILKTDIDWEADFSGSDREVSLRLSIHVEASDRWEDSFVSMVEIDAISFDDASADPWIPRRVFDNIWLAKVENEVCRELDVYVQNLTREIRRDREEDEK